MADQSGTGGRPVRGRTSQPRSSQPRTSQPRTSQPRTSQSRAGQPRAERNRAGRPDETGGRQLRPGVKPKPRTKPAATPRTAKPGARAGRKRRRGPLRIPLAHTARRLHVVLIAIAIMLSLCAGRLIQLQGFDSSAYAAISAEALVRKLPLLPSRGDLTDRSGVLMATTEPAVAVTADPTLTRTRANEFAEVLSRHLHVPTTKLVPLLIKPNSRFVYLKKKVPAMTYSRMAAELADRDLYGIFRESDPIRTYPGQSVAGGLVGFVNGEGKGVAGVEQKLNTELAGVEGKEEYESSPSGGRIPLGSSTVTPAQNGLNYQLTIDSELQWMAERRLAKQVASSKSDFGFAITMNVKTGEILALAQAPTVDSSDPGAIRADHRVVRAVSGPYEPGSVQKVLTAAALMDSGVADPETRLVIPDRLRGNGRQLKDAFEHGEIRLNMRGVVARSSNIGMVMLARQMNKAKLVDYLHKFGLGAKTGIELPGESGGIMAGRDLKDLTRDQMAFGQSLAVTGVQEIAAIAGLVNDGVYQPPTLLKSATTSDGKPVALPGKTPRRIVKSQTSDQIRDVMKAVVDTPNGQRNLAVENYSSGGKTGTAQRVDDKCGCYKGYVTSYIGFAPVNDPQIITYVVLNNPKKGDTGTSVAAPVYQDIMQVALPRYSVLPTKDKHDPLPIKWGDDENDR
jgi:cell division protein FtsI (penicillin-binding protein 3)